MSVVSLPPSFPEQDIAAIRRFITAALRQLSVPGRRQFRVRTPSGAVVTDRREVVRLLSVARRIVRLQRVREQYRARWAPQAAASLMALVLTLGVLACGDGERLDPPPPPRIVVELT